MEDTIERLGHIGFSEYEAKAYLALLRKSPITGYELAKLSGVPRSMIYEVLGRLASRGAVLMLPEEGGTRYAALPPNELLERLRHEYEEILEHLGKDLTGLPTASDLDYIWNIQGYDNILAKAGRVIDDANTRIYAWLFLEDFEALKKNLDRAAKRGVEINIASAEEIDFPQGKVVVHPMEDTVMRELAPLGLTIVADSQEVLIGEREPTAQAKAAWTRNHLLVATVETRLRFTIYAPQMLDLLGEKLMGILHDEEHEILRRLLRMPRDE